MRFLLGSEDPKLTARYDAVLPRPILESMWEPVKVDLKNESRSIGLGFFRYAYALPLIGHTGSANGFISSFYVQPESKLAWFVVGNTWNFSEVMNPLGKGIVEKLVGCMR